MDRAVGLSLRVIVIVLVVAAHATGASGAQLMPPAPTPVPLSLPEEVPAPSQAIDALEAALDDCARRVSEQTGISETDARSLCYSIATSAVCTVVGVATQYQEAYVACVVATAVGSVYEDQRGQRDQDQGDSSSNTIHIGQPGPETPEYILDQLVVDCARKVMDDTGASLEVATEACAEVVGLGACAPGALIDERVVLICWALAGSKIRESARDARVTLGEPATRVDVDSPATPTSTPRPSLTRAAPRPGAGTLVNADMTFEKEDGSDLHLVDDQTVSTRPGGPQTGQVGLVQVPTATASPTATRTTPVVQTPTGPQIRR